MHTSEIKAEELVRKDRHTAWATHFLLLDDFKHAVKTW
jgi:hypothetical protein